MNAPNDPFLSIVRDVAAEFYHVYGELGREGEDQIWYLARSLDAGRLVALKLLRTGQGADGKPAYDLEVAEELDGNVSVGAEDCPACGTALRRWARFCTHCGVDLTTVGGGGADTPARAQLLEQVRQASAGVYDVIGEMPWAGGAGAVFFALELASGRLVRLRLREAAGGGELAETQVLMPMGEPVAATYVTGVLAPPPVAPAAPPPAATVPERPRPAAPRPSSRPVTVELFGREVDALRTIRILGAAVLILLLLQLIQLVF